MIEFEPLVSVCVPTYNRAKKLKKAVRSLLDGRYKNIEIIISDNGSVDETEEICRELTFFNSRIKYFRQSKNLGPTKNFEFARSKAHGKYFMWHGDDDCLDIDYIKNCVESLELNQDLIFISGVGAYINGDQDIKYYGNILDLTGNHAIFRVLKYLLQVGDNSIFYALYRTEMVRDCIIPNFLAGDWAWVSSVLAKGRGKMIPNLYVYREFEESSSSSYIKMVQILGAPLWHAKYPWLAQISNLIPFISNEVDDFKGKGFIYKKFLEFLLFIVMAYKMVYINIRIELAKIKYLKKLYLNYKKL